MSHSSTYTQIPSEVKEHEKNSTFHLCLFIRNLPQHKKLRCVLNCWITNCRQEGSLCCPFSLHILIPTGVKNKFFHPTFNVLRQVRCDIIYDDKIRFLSTCESSLWPRTRRRKFKKSRLTKKPTRDKQTNIPWSWHGFVITQKEQILSRSQSKMPGRKFPSCELCAVKLKWGVNRFQIAQPNTTIITCHGIANGRAHG